MKKILFVLYYTIFLSINAISQNQDDISLAFNYYNNKEFEKASYLFESLFNQTKSKSYFNYYVKCLTETSDFDKAEKVVKKQISAYKNDLTYKVMLGSIYKSQGKFDKSTEQYDAVINSLSTDNNAIISVCNQFLQADENDYAEKTLLQGAILTGKDFNTELFSVYASTRNYKKMCETGLDIIEKDENQRMSVQNMFQYYLNNDVNDEMYNILRSSLMQRIQTNPITAYSDMLIWIYVQKKNYKMAVNQAKAIDRRQNEPGFRLISLGQQAIDAGDYASATDAYKYVLAKGKENQFYSQARLGVLNAMYQQVKEGTINDVEQFLYLESEYKSIFDEHGYNTGTINHVINYARLETYYLNKPDVAENIINQALEQKNLNYSLKANLKLELGDIYLYTTKVWDAIMTYAQVESENKQNENGDEAKLRKAKVAYYTGSFKWSLSQLDVLKASTSKLVANDAMELSILINDNLVLDIPGADTSENQLNNQELEIFARGDMYIVQNKLEDAFSSFDSVATQFKSSGLVDEALYRQGQVCERQKKYIEAVSYYKKVADEYSYDNLADKASFRCAELSVEKLEDTETAKTYYLKILSDYPGSVFAVEAREKYRKISGK
ncbi:MAG: tetratricopeptide repeat protein [Bacteroidales bacterium]|nr:tetratricopeptide repeat protein [Bacteroidales bacterium]